MALNPKWNIEAVDVANVGPLVDVVTAVHWRRYGEYMGEAFTEYGVVGIPPPEEGKFTPFEELTKEDVTAWTVKALGAEKVASVDANLEGATREKAAPTARRKDEKLQTKSEKDQKAPK